VLPVEGDFCRLQFGSLRQRYRIGDCLWRGSTRGCRDIKRPTIVRGMEFCGYGPATLAATAILDRAGAS
jgi:hypothetical protein